MKIILTAFGDRLRSEVMEWPEDVGPDALLRFKWFPGEIAASIKREKDNYAPLEPSQVVTMEFKETGRSYDQEDGSLAREFELVNWYGERR